jgi:hypothetical protein
MNGNGNRALEFLQAVYMNDELPLLTRVRVAAMCLPYENPKLLACAVVNEQSFAELLDRRLKKVAEMKLLDNKTINGTATITEPTFQPEPQSPPPMTSPLTRIYSNRFRRRI